MLLNSGVGEATKQKEAELVDSLVPSHKSNLAAGVAEGTAIGLVAITSSTEWMQAIYKRWNAAAWRRFQF